MVNYTVAASHVRLDYTAFLELQRYSVCLEHEVATTRYCFCPIWGVLSWNQVMVDHIRKPKRLEAYRKMPPLQPNPSFAGRLLVSLARAPTLFLLVTRPVTPDPTYTAPVQAKWTTAVAIVANGYNDGINTKAAGGAKSDTCDAAVAKESKKMPSNAQSTPSITTGHDAEKFSYSDSTEKENVVEVNKTRTQEPQAGREEPSESSEENRMPTCM